MTGRLNIKLDYPTLQRTWEFHSLEGTSFFPASLPLQSLFGNNDLDLKSTTGKKAVYLLLCLLMALTNNFFFFNASCENILITSSNGSVELHVFKLF